MMSVTLAEVEARIRKIDISFRAWMKGDSMCMYMGRRDDAVWLMTFATTTSGWTFYRQKDSYMHFTRS